MSAPVISASAAQDLNRKIQEKIDPRLFLCCNYTPTTSYTLGEDAKFFTAIQDLYKFAQDSSCLINSSKNRSYKKLVPWEELPRALQEECKRLDADLELIRVLRSVMDHNNSELNGYLSKERLDRYGEWIQQTLGKPAPETQADFGKLYQKLENIASRTLNTLDHFIDCAAAHRNRNQVVGKWIDLTLYWYSHNTTQDIYKGQIMDAYITKAKENGTDYPDLYRSKTLLPKIQRWIVDAFCAPVDTKRKEVASALKTNQDILNGTTPFAAAMRGKMSAADWSKMEAICRERIAESEKFLADLEQKRKDLEERIGDHPLDFFFDGLEDRLRDTMSECEANGIPYTLLPQDLLQMNVEAFFGETPSYWGDF